MKHTAKSGTFPKEGPAFISPLRVCKGGERSVSHIYIQLGDKFKGRMHGKHRHADVYHVDVAVRHILATVPPPPKSTLPSSPVCHSTSARSRMSVT